MPTDDNMGGESQSLTLVLVDPKGEDDHYAIVPFPETYENAKAAAIGAFGSYMDEDAPDIVLRRSLQNRKGEWIWADIHPEHWRTIVVRGSTEVGIFHRPRLVPELFAHGPVHFTYARDEGKGISWSSLNRQGLDPTMPNGMDRPETFQEAMDVVRRKVYFPKSQDDTFTFCIFPNGDLLTWYIIPEHVCADDARWQKVVPEPGQILGVIVKKKK